MNHHELKDRAWYRVLQVLYGVILVFGLFAPLWFSDSFYFYGIYYLANPSESYDVINAWIFAAIATISLWLLIGLVVREALIYIIGGGRENMTDGKAQRVFGWRFFLKAVILFAVFLIMPGFATTVLNAHNQAAYQQMMAAHGGS